MKHLRASIKFFCFIIAVMTYLIESGVAALIYREQKKRRHVFTDIVQRYTRIANRVVGIHVNGIHVPDGSRSYLFVGNHLGFLDILVLSSRVPSLFITSVEMRDTPFLGTLCEHGGCLFVERRDRSKVPGEIQQIREALKQDLNITLYPEGTSGDGSKVLPFKKSLLMAAAGTGVPIKPVVINYRKIDGKPISHATRNYVCWYGDMGFLSSLWALFTLKRIDVDIEFLEEIHVDSEEQRKEIAARAQGLIEARFTPIPFPSSIQ